MHGEEFMLGVIFNPYCSVGTDRIIILLFLGKVRSRSVEVINKIRI